MRNVLLFMSVLKGANNRAKENGPGRPIDSVIMDGPRERDECLLHCTLILNINKETYRCVVKH